jgi:hypothetical protein
MRTSATPSIDYHICFSEVVIVSVCCTNKNRVAKIVCSSFEMVLQTTKHTMIYPGSGLSMEVIALRPVF